MSIAFCQIWEESERGWGVRPDGYSLHLTLEDATNFRIEYMNNQSKYFKENGVIGVPDEYTRPYGNPKKVNIDEELYNQLVKERNIRFNDNVYPEEV